jgi:uncharacterized membrane protein
MLPSLAAFHPQVVHFVIGLLIVGVLFRIVALTGRLKWTGPAATTLLVIGGCAAWLAAKSGTAAHAPVERIPGVREAVQSHELWGERTRNVFVGVAALELVALALGTSGLARTVRAVSALAGLAGVVVLYEAAEHGGDLVYSYAGGPGIRTGNPQDVQRLLTAGLYNEAQVERKAGKGEDANRLIQMLVERDPTVDTRLLWAESLLRDKKDPAAALATLDSITVRPDDARLRPRRDMLVADALRQAGRTDSARTVLQALATQFPANPRIKAKLDSLK